MEIFAFTENAVGYEDPRPEPQLRSFEEINLEVPKSAVLGVAGVVAASAIATSPYTAEAVVQQGDVCPEVGAVQRSLNSLGFSVGAADDIFGSRTTNGVRSFQASRGLAVDGVVGPSTADALGLGDAGNADSPFLIGNSCGGGSSAGDSGTGTVNASALTVRTGPGVGFGTVGTLSSGTGVTYDTSSRTNASGYVWVRLDSGAFTGRWIAEDFLSTGGDGGGTGQETSSTVTASSLVVRTGPGTGFGSVGSLGSGTTVFFDPTSRTSANGYTWVEITQGAYAGRWVAENFLGTGEGGGTGQEASNTVNASSLVVRTGPGTGFGSVGSLGLGTTIFFDPTSRTSANGYTWVEITRGAYAGRWVAENFLGSGSGGGGSASGVGRVSTTSGQGVRVRTGAGTGFGVAGSLPEGAVVNYDVSSATANNGYTWVRITSGAFANRYIAREFLR
ncbi:MAG: peptidoglycan-binding protein [Leptolyngbyaceae bacterium]|nr:peptidoglycan-binding protein [Leptolyngbyaceae bacterium]